MKRSTSTRRYFHQLHFEFQQILKTKIAMSSTKSEFVHTTPDYWSFVMPTEIRVSKKWHDSVTLDERKHALGSILSSLMMKGDMKIFKDYENIGGQIYMATTDESHIYEIADSQSEYYKKIKEKT